MSRNTITDITLGTRQCALPAGGATTKSAPLDSGDIPAKLNGNYALLADAPAMNSTQLPDGETLTYSIISCSDSALSSVVSTTQIGVQKGAGGAGAAAATFAAKAPIGSGGQYLGLQIVASASAVPGSAKVPLYIAAW